MRSAARRFGERGFAGTTVEAIAAGAGVSNGLLYQFFRNKEHLFEVVVDRVLREWVRAMVAREEPEPRSAADRLEGLFRRSYHFARSHPLLPALLCGEAGRGRRGTGSVAPERVVAHRAHVARILREGIESGELAPDLDVDAVADVICTLQVEYSVRAYRRDPLFPVSDAHVDAAVRFIRDAVTRR